MSVLLKQGQEVEAKPARPVTVYSVSLQDFSPPLFTIGYLCIYILGMRLAVYMGNV